MESKPECNSDVRHHECTEYLPISKSSPQLISDLLAQGRGIEAATEMELDLDSAILKWGADKPFVIRRHAQTQVFIDILNRFSGCLEREAKLNNTINELTEEVRILKGIVHALRKKAPDQYSQFIDGLCKLPQKPKEGLTIED